MTNEDIKALNKEEIKEKILTEGEALRKLKFAHKVSAIENPMKIKESRKLVARLKTELAVKEITK
jgi:large subunit ribosomal protein L29